MIKNCVDIIKSPEFNALDNIIRFSKVSIIKPESVSQHTYWVTMFTTMLLEELELVTYTGISKYDVLLQALFHDFDEGLTGDVVYDFKHNKLNGNQVVSSINNYVDLRIENEFNSQHTPEIVIRRTRTASTTIMKGCGGMRDYDRKWIIKKILKISDWLACIKYEWSEIRLGNSNFQSLLSLSEVELNKVVDMLIEFLKDEEVLTHHDEETLLNLKFIIKSLKS